MAPHSSTLAWRIPWTEEPCRLQSMESDTTELLHFQSSLSCIGEGNGNPLQCSCLESPRDGGAWWAAIYGVAQSRTRLKRLSSSSSSSMQCWSRWKRLYQLEVTRCWCHCHPLLHPSSLAVMVFLFLIFIGVWLTYNVVRFRSTTKWITYTWIQYIDPLSFLRLFPM